MSDRVIVTSGLSKAYGIPGVDAFGWIVGPQDVVAQCWSQHDYITIGPGKLSDAVARVAVRPENREKLYARTHWSITFRSCASGPPISSSSPFGSRRRRFVPHALLIAHPELRSASAYAPTTCSTGRSPRSGRLHPRLAGGKPECGLRRIGASSHVIERVNG